MLIEEVMAGILQKLPGQTFSFKRMKNLWTSEEKARFERELEYLTEKYSVEEIIDGYVFLTETTMEETKYFHEHGEYRCRSFAEVDKATYSNQEASTKIMLGLSFAEYLWETVLGSHRFYEAVINEAQGERYLEIGPGHGKYFVEALNKERFKEYTAVDISPTSIRMTEEYTKLRGLNIGEKKVRFICQDAMQLDTTEKYDFIVIQEVLEHLEDPFRMLQMIKELLTSEGRAYALMPICAPSPQHIFLFRDREHVRNLVEQAGLEIVREQYITANNVAAETAEAKKLPINACLLMKKK